MNSDKYLDRIKMKLNAIGWDKVNISVNNHDFMINMNNTDLNKSGYLNFTKYSIDNPIKISSYSSNITSFNLNMIWKLIGRDIVKYYSLNITPNMKENHIKTI